MILLAPDLVRRFGQPYLMQLIQERCIRGGDTRPMVLEIIRRLSSAVAHNQETQHQ